MNRLQAVLSALLVCAGILGAQPLSGSFTVGGTSPGFATLQDAANALKTRGVSGPVFLNLRPGTYTRDGGATTLMILDSTIAGTSPTNRITVQPDIASGGNPSNVLLQADFNTTTPASSRNLVVIGTDHVTLRNLIFRDADSMDTPAACLLSVVGDFQKPTVEDLEVVGCTFQGSRFFTAGVQFATDFGISCHAPFGTGFVISGVFTDNVFDGLNRFISVASISHGGTFDVERNVFRNGYVNFSGSGNPLGAAIELTCAHATVRDNDVQFSPGNWGIVVSQAVTALVERNLVLGRYRVHGMDINRGSSQGIVADSIILVNNIVYCEAGTSLFVQTVNTKLLHNTIYNAGGFGTTSCYLDGQNFTVFDNIFINESGRSYDQGSSTGIISDYNLIFARGSEIVVHGGIIYPSFGSYQAASHLDSNSSSSEVSFLADSLGLRIEECQAQDRAFNGTPLPSVRFDYYGAPRDTVVPFIGAVEGVRLPYDMFAAPFKAGTSGFALSLATGRFDSPTTDGIAIPDYDHRLVQLFHNSGSGRTFAHNGTVFTGFRPTVVKLFDLDNDGHLDLLAAGDTATSSLKIFWGDGTGGFSGPATVETFGRVTSLEGGPRFVNFSTVVTTEDNGFLPNQSFVGYTMCTAGRQLCYDAQRSGPSLAIDTINAVLGDLVLADLGGGQNMPAIVSPGLFGTSNVIPKLFVFDVGAIGGSLRCQAANNFFQSIDHEYAFPVTGYYTPASSIVTGDFDGDGDNDFITTGFSENECVVIRNQGNFTFSADTITTTATRGLAVLDYENDGDLDFVTVNRMLDSLGVTVFLNDGTGHFAEKRNCYYPFASGWPNGVVAADFDGDGKTDIAVVSRTFGGFDSLFVLYNLGGNNGTTGVVAPHRQETPQGFTLFQNYPNPFNPLTHIDYTLQAQGHVIITIYNILGQEIAALVDELQGAGNHSVEWNGKSTHGSPVGSGVYFYRVEVRQPGGQFTLATVKKMVLMK